MIFLQLSASAGRDSLLCIENLLTGGVLEASAAALTMHLLQKYPADMTPCSRAAQQMHAKASDMPPTSIVDRVAARATSIAGAARSSLA